MKNNFKKLTITLALSLGLTSTLNGSNIVTKSQCNDKGEEYIFAGGECIQFYESEGDTENSLNIIVHGTWKEGTNTLARYTPFADNLSMATDITTVAVSLPGYSDSSTNNFKALSHNGTANLAAQKSYIEFLSKLVTKLKDKYDAKEVNYIGHSAGAMMGTTLVGYNPGLISTITSAGGVYDIHKKEKNSDNLVSLVDYIDNVDRKTKFLLVYGTKDKISEPKITKDFYNIVKEKGFEATLIEVVDAPHLDLDMTDESVEAISEMLESE
ncbi:MAG: alpha/beta fold hydrolase [Campylobacterota bacterium]|nr:alpha/beta fold hydrolase [Campylobacterota bacterium]